MQRKMCVVCGALVAIFGVATARAASAASEQDHAARVARVLDEHTIPGFAALNGAAAKLPAAVSQVCTSSDGQSAASLRAAFRDTAVALAGVDFYRFGPLADQGRRERLSFWPDPRGIMVRQLRQVLNAKDQDVLTTGGIARQSAAIQGLPALELLMTDKDVPLGPGDNAKYACGLAAVIAANVSNIAAQSYDAWIAKDGARDAMLAAGAQTSGYKTRGEAAAELLRSLLTGLQTVAELQLKPRLEGAKPAGKGPFAKLGLERDVYQAATASLQRLYVLLDLEAKLAPDKAWMKNWVSGTWRAIAMSDGMGGPSQSVPASDAPKLNELVSRIGGMRMLIGKEMSNASGIAIGFNELDGD